MTQEKSPWHLSGIGAWLGLFAIWAVIIGSACTFYSNLTSVTKEAVATQHTYEHPKAQHGKTAKLEGESETPPPTQKWDWQALILPLGTMLGALWLCSGFNVIQPNDAMVLVFVGSYAGTVKRNGLVLVNPLCSRKRISMKMQNLHGEKLKVNDKRGNPIEIGAVVVWHVAEPAKAIFDVDSYELFVTIQSEAAVRHLANLYAYDGDGEETTLRSGLDEVSHTLREELEQRLSRAGIAIDEARIAHLAYAPEIAMAMLKRQQAEAIISAKRAIVSGAVSIVTGALQELSKSKLVDLDEERKAAMISNLLVVLCSDTQVQPVVNTGTLYP